MKLKIFITRTSRHLEFKERHKLNGVEYRSVFINNKYKQSNGENNY